MATPRAERSVSIFHGAGNNREGNWFQEVKRRLERTRRFKDVWVPDLPDSETPQTETWLNHVKATKPLESFDNALLIAHSAGSTLTLRLLEALPEGVVADQAILVAGFVDRGTIDAYYHYKDGLLEGGFNWDKIKASCRKFTFVHSDNDQYECGVDQGRIMQQHLGGELIVKVGEGHFNLETNPKYDDFPLIMSLVSEE